MHYVKIPQNLNIRQTLLTLKVVTNLGEAPLDNENTTQTGVIGTWKFDTDSIRTALAQMVIVDELPFRFFEGYGFQNFMHVACPRFKIGHQYKESTTCV